MAAAGCGACCSRPRVLLPGPERAPRRRHPARGVFRHALSAFLDLVVISLAGGAGSRRPHQRLRRVAPARRSPGCAASAGGRPVTRQPPWSASASPRPGAGRRRDGRAGRQITLAGTEGAKVKTSLAAKAATLRAHQLAAAETQAQAATERMSLPLVLLFAGFLVLVGFPAIVHVLTGL